MGNEHLYSPKQAARQTEDILYTHGKEVHKTIKSQKCVSASVGLRLPKPLARGSAPGPPL